MMKRKQYDPLIEEFDMEDEKWGQKNMKNLLKEVKNENMH